MFVAQHGLRGGQRRGCRPVEPMEIQREHPQQQGKVFATRITHPTPHGPHGTHSPRTPGCFSATSSCMALPTGPAAPWPGRTLFILGSPALLLPLASTCSPALGVLCPVQRQHAQVWEERCSKGLSCPKTLCFLKKQSGVGPYVRLLVLLAGP